MRFKYESTGILLAASLLAACGGAKDKAASRGSGGRPFVITMIAKSSTNPVFLSARTGAEAAAAELSKSLGVEIKIDWRTPPNEDGTVQAQRIADHATNIAEDVVYLAEGEIIRHRPVAL